MNHIQQALNTAEDPSVIIRLYNIVTGRIGTFEIMVPDEEYTPLMDDGRYFATYTNSGEPETLDPNQERLATENDGVGSSEIKCCDCGKTVSGFDIANTTQCVPCEMMSDYMYSGSRYHY